jgi:hypothetical protein
MTGIQWRDFGSNACSIIYGAIPKNTISFLQIVLSVHLKVVSVLEKSCLRLSMSLVYIFLFSQSSVFLLDTRIGRVYLMTVQTLR